MARIHITGASGAGTSTLGRAVADALRIRHIETDEIFWLPTDPPFSTRRPTDDRVALLLAEAQPDRSWVLSGSALKWGSVVEPFYDLIVFVHLDPELRMQRLRQREAGRYGARILPGGDMANHSAEFLDWAASYDTAGPERRSLAAHEQWLAGQAAPILRLDSARPLDGLVAQVVGHPAVQSQGAV